MHVEQCLGFGIRVGPAPRERTLEYKANSAKQFDRQWKHNRWLPDEVPDERVLMAQRITELPEVPVVPDDELDGGVAPPPRKRPRAAASAPSTVSENAPEPEPEHVQSVRSGSDSSSSSSSSSSSDSDGQSS